MICICNDRQSPKVRSLVNYCLDLKFQKPTLQQISKRLEEICFKERLDLAPNALNGIINSTNGDIRQVLNLLQTWSLRKDSLTYDESAKLYETL